MAMTREAARGAARDLQLESSSRLAPVYFHGLTMLPFLAEGDLLITEPVPFEEIRPGDVVTYRDADFYPTRRVIEIQPRKRRLVIRADNLPMRIFHVEADDVLARVVERRRGGQRLVDGDLEWRWARVRALWRFRPLSRNLRLLVRGLLRRR